MKQSRQDETQPDQLAAKLRVPVATVRDWEQHRRSPDAPARTLLGMVDADPKAAMMLLERVMITRHEHGSTRAPEHSVTGSQ